MHFWRIWEQVIVIDCLKCQADNFCDIFLIFGEIKPLYYRVNHWPADGSHLTSNIAPKV